MSLKEKLLTRVQEDDEDGELGGEDSEDERIREEQEKLKRKKTEIEAKKEIKSVVVGTGFSFDITEFFTFQKASKVGADELVRQMTSEELFMKKISGGHLAWFILLYSVCNAAAIPPWIMSIKATKLIRISWRFLLQSFMVIPFVLYEHRTGGPKVKEMYSLSHIFKLQHFKKVYVSSFATTFWFTIILTTFQWTYISHAMVLGALSNFFLSVMRMFNGEKNHELQKGGQVMVMLGFIMVLLDAYLLVPSEEPAYVYNVINPFYLGRQPWMRVTACIIAFFVSFVMSNFSRYNADLKDHYPPYLSMLIVNICICINMCFTTYFFNGGTFDLHSFYGVWSIFSELHFAGFMYMSIILGLGLFLSLVMMTKLFEDPVTPAVGMLFQPIVSTILLQIVGVQTLPGALACIGYVFILPGQFLIVMGQYVLKKSNQQKQKIEQEGKKSEQEILKLKARVQQLQMVQMNKKPSSHENLAA